MPNVICNGHRIGGHAKQRLSPKMKTLCLKFCQRPAWPTSIGKFFYQNLFAFCAVIFNPDRNSEVMGAKVEGRVVNRPLGIHVTRTIKRKCLSKYAGSKVRRP